MKHYLQSLFGYNMITRYSYRSLSPHMAQTVQHTRVKGLLVNHLQHWLPQSWRSVVSSEQSFSFIQYFHCHTQSTLTKQNVICFVLLKTLIIINVYYVCVLLMYRFKRFRNLLELEFWETQNKIKYSLISIVRLSQSVGVLVVSV